MCGRDVERRGGRGGGGGGGGCGRDEQESSGLCLVTSGGRPGGASGLRLHTRLVAGVARVRGHVVATRGRLAEGQEATHAVIGGHPPPLACCLPAKSKKRRAAPTWTTPAEFEPDKESSLLTDLNQPKEFLDSSHIFPFQRGSLGVVSSVCDVK